MYGMSSTDVEVEGGSGSNDRFFIADRREQGNKKIRKFG
jgi:hypothetical protein